MRNFTLEIVLNYGSRRITEYGPAIVDNLSVSDEDFYWLVLARLIQKNNCKNRLVRIETQRRTHKPSSPTLR